jgi:hypothetical protein
LSESGFTGFFDLQDFLTATALGFELLQIL